MKKDQMTGESTARIRQTIENNRDKGILCTVGAEHNYFYYEELIKLGYDVVYPIK